MQNQPLIDIKVGFRMKAFGEPSPCAQGLGERGFV